MRHILVFPLIIVLVALLNPVGLLAQPIEESVSCLAPKIRTDVRPNSKGTPTVVMFGLRVIDLLGISDVDQTISVDLALRMQWTDPRLSAWEGCRLSVRDIWFPELFMKNSGRVFHRWPDTVSIEDGGRVTYLQRVSGTFSSYHKLAGYPFDAQVISINLYPLHWSNEKLVFRIDEAFVGSASLLNVSDWRLTGLEAKLVEENLPGLEKMHSGIALDISVERHLSYYIWKIMVPIVLIVVMSWSVFWIDPKQFGTQIGLSATSVLTMVAFIFATTSMLPRLGYFTMLDRYIAIATVFVFLALLQSLTTGYLASQDRVVFARRIDLVCRMAFPIAFFTICLATFAEVL